MRTLIFSTKEEAKDLKEKYQGEIFDLSAQTSNLWNLFYHLDQSENAVAIIVGNGLEFGWATHHAAKVLFSDKYSTDENTRQQARSRVRGNGAELMSDSIRTLRFMVFDNEDQYYRAKESDKLKAEVIVVGDRVVKCRPSKNIQEFIKVLELVKNHPI